MKITPINNRYITPKTTGYAAAGGLALTVLSAVSKNKNLRQTHKPLAYISVVLSLFHIILAEYNHYCYTHKQL